MYFIGIDPGANYNGLAILNDDVFVFHDEYWSPVKLWGKIEPLVALGKDQVHTVVEDMIGGGRRDVFIKKTILALGYFQNRLIEADAYVEVTVPNARKAYVSQVPTSWRKDERSAGAHALALRERHLAGIRQAEQRRKAKGE